MGPLLYVYDNEKIKPILGFVNSKVAYTYLNILAPTIAFESGDIAKTPVKMPDSQSETITQIVNENLELSKSDWDSFETSWDFKRHPLV